MRKRDDEKYALVRNCYINGEDIESISSRLEIPKSTIERWKNGDKKDGNDWDRSRLSIKNFENSCLDIYSDFILLKQKVRELLGDKVTIKDLKEIAQAYEAITRTTKRVSLSFDKHMFTIDLLNYLDDFVKLQYPENIDFIREIREPFAISLLDSNIFTQK